MKKVLFSLVIISFIACDQEARLASIDVVPTIDALVGEKITLNVTHSPADALVPAFHYQSDDESIATVNKQGVVVCRQAGTCTIHIGTADTRFSTACVINVKSN